MKKRQIPHTYVIIFYIILFCALLTLFVPGGQYQEVLSADGTKSLVYQPVAHVPQTWQLFAAFYQGFVDKADIIVFILIIGGAFWIVNDSKAFDMGTVSFLRKARGIERSGRGNCGKRLWIPRGGCGLWGSPGRRSKESFSAPCF